jgi:hypothetical protein
MFGIILESDPLKLEYVPSQVQSWLLTAGVLAAVGLGAWLAVRVATGRGPGRQETRRRGAAFVILVPVLGALLLALPAALYYAWGTLGWSDAGTVSPAKASVGRVFAPQDRYLVSPYEGVLLRYGAACALAAAMLPVLGGMGRLRLRRILALAKLSFKEAVRRRVLWVFSIFLLVFLFAAWFIDAKDEYQLRTYVYTVYTAMTVLLLLTAALLASFGLPADLRAQTIHTIVTKPVERFEIVIGRFLGYGALVTLVLAVMTALSLGYVFRTISEEAKQESYTARVPVFGEFQIAGGKNVGYEWEYRKYITVPDKPDEPEFAMWTFASLPRELAAGDTPVRCEFTFEIFRTTKGREEGKGILCSFFFENWQRRPGQQPGLPPDLDRYRQERQRLLDEANVARSAAAVDSELAVKYGIYEIPAKEIVDFHTLEVDVPRGLFRNLSEWYALGPAERAQRPPLRVVVRCESRTQYLGVAKHDLYLLAGQRGFEQNFVKGAVGLWFLLCLVIGVAVTLSTWLSGVITFLATMFLVGLGMVLDFARTVAEGKSMGGGPLENALRLRPGGHPSIPLDQSPLVTIVQNADKVLERALGVVLNLVPDVDRYDLTGYVADGFNISGMQLALTGLLLVGYLLPWLILAYYLMRAREVAS